MSYNRYLKPGDIHSVSDELAVIGELKILRQDNNSRRRAIFIERNDSVFTCKYKYDVDIMFGKTLNVYDCRIKLESALELRKFDVQIWNGV